MPAPWVALDVIPEAGRPAKIQPAFKEASDLRARYRRAQEELAELEQRLEQVERDDVAEAAQRVRAGSAPGNVPAVVTKARQAVETAKRNSAAIGLASDASQGDLVAAIREHSVGWFGALDSEQQQARERARAALDTFESAIADMRAAAGAAGWLTGALQDGRFDRRAPMPLLGSAAPSSARHTANNAPLAADDVIAYARELVEPPVPAAAELLVEAPADVA
jgi:hypothetical protein